MKKLITLLILFVGMVSTASAANITRRIWAYCDWGGKWQSTDHDIRIHYFKSDGTDITSWDASETQYMSRFGGSNWFYYDITADESDLTGVKVIIRANDGDEQTYTYGNSSENMNLVTTCYKLKVESKDKVNRATVSELKYYLLNASSKTRTEMTTDDCRDFIATIDNQTTPVNNDYVIAASFAFADDWVSGSDDGKIYWGLVWRPWDEHQTLDFSKCLSRSLFIHDTKTNALKTNNVPACFSITFHLMTSTPSYDINPYRTATIGKAGYLTYSNGEKYTVSGATAYTAQDMGTYAKLSAIDGGTVFPAGTGLLLRGSGEVTINAVASDASTATYTSNYASNNNLKGSGNSGASISEGCFVLYWDGTNPSSVCFRKTTSGDLAAHKAYLPAGSLAREFLSFEEGETTGIETVKASQKMNGEFFNLAGQRVAQPAKGLYIVNGKKVIMK